MDTRRLHFRRLLLLLFALCSFRGAAYAQYEVYANQLISNTADFINPGRAVDADQTNYTYIAAGVGALTSSSLRVRFPEWGNAGDVINIPVQSGSGLLSLSLLDNITIKLYDSAGTTPVATVSGSSLLQLSLLTPGSNIYNLRFITNPSLGFKFKEAQVELNDVLSVSLTQFRVYNVFFQRPCPPVYADKVTAAGASGLLSLASVSNEDRVVDSNPDNYATMNTILSLLGIGQAYIEVGFPRYGKAGDYVGFTVAATSGLLDLSVLSSFTIITYDETGAVKETKAGSSLLTLRLLSGTTNRYSVGFVTAKGSYKISKIRLVKTAVLGLLENVRVYNAFYYTINRPPVTVTTSGPTSFCEGGSVTLTAYDSLGATNYVWSTGATTASITVKTSGTYYVEVTDTFSCVRRSIPIGVIVNPLPRPVITGDSVLCAGNSGSLNLGAVTYASQLWSTGATTASITNVTAGKYYVTVTDVNSCKGADTINVIQNKLNISAAITATTCSNTATGGVSLTVSGGSGTYTYRWSTGATTASVTGLKEGIYTCLIRDNVYNCTYNRSFSVSASNTLSAKVAVVNTSACGQSDGKINLSVIGGSGTYNYLWSNGATTSGITTSAGIYTVTITDATSGCSIKDTVAIGDGGNNLVLTPAITNAASCSSPDGAVALTVTGGSGTYTYSWSTGATTASVSGLKPGNYYVVVKDGACSKALSVVVGSATSLVVNATVVRPGCKKQNGSITIGSVSGGSGSYTYSWSTGATTASVTGLQAGTYLVTVTDAGRGCTKQEVYTLADSSGPTATLAATQPDCGTNSNGAITVTAGGANNVYAWSTGAVTKNLTSLKPGIYTLTVTDTVTGCVAVYQAVLTAKGQMRITASPSSNTSCAEAPDGSVSVTIVGGVSPYTYAWSGGETTKDISGKNAGTYNLTVTDANSCVATISVPVRTDSTKLLKASLSSIVKATCNTAANGSAFVTVTGGKAPLTYSWTPGGAATKDLVNVLAGSYTLKVTDGAGCIQQLNVNITIDSAVAMKGTIDSTKAAGCAGSATGAVYVSISGGTAPYTYQWKKGAAIVAAVKNLVGVSAGTYTLTVTDNNGCTLQLNANVPVISTGVTVTLDSVTRPTCNVSADGKVYVTVTGGTSPYTYSWSTGATTEDLTGANPGLLTVTATDALGCPGQLTVNLTYDTSKTLVVKADSARGAGCITGRSGALYITASGGTMPYVYAWTEGSVTPDLINVAPGTYGVTVTDIRGCKANVSGSIGVDTSKSIKAVIDSTEGAGCIGSKSGKIYLTVTRGVAPYTYSWSNGATTKDLTNVAPGLYAVIIADAAGCSQSLSASVGLDLTKKIELTVDSVKGASCILGANGSVFVTVKGGKAPYLYSWSNGANTASLTNVIPGLYSLTVQDANGCTAELTATVGVDASRAITITGVSIKDAGCIGNASGAISVAVAGGVPPYTYLWSNGATTRDVTGLKPGSYTLTVRDFAGCTAEYSANIKVDVANEIKATASSVVAAKCAGSSSGSVTVSVTGGVSPYTYSWSNGANTKDLSFVQSGSYLLTVTDAIGCTGTLSVNVGIDNSNPVVVKLDSVKAVGCADTLSGAVYVSVSGGTTPYSYMWSTGAVTQDLLNVKVGTYSLNVTDNAGCSDDLSATVGKATQIIVNGDVDMVNCYGGNDGSITVKINGGSGNYRYEWTDGNASGTRTGLVAGSYTVTVTDNASGCTGKDTFAVTQADSLVVSAVVVKDSCLPGFDGRISLLVNGGTKPYTYNWSNGDQTDLIQNLAPQNYTVTITDAGGCKATETYAVGAVDCDFTLTIYDVITPNGDGKNDVWVIGGIEFYPNSVLQVVDKWGDIVYEKKGYDNSFTGISSKNNQELPSGTYYYVLKLNGANKTGGKNTFTGSLLIER